MGPDHWVDLEGSFCGESSQSPIDIVLNDTVYKEFEDFQMEGYSLDDGNINGGKPTRLDNNGHTAVVTLEGNYKLTGGGLPSTFKAVQFHIHWGSVDDKGSEHTVSNKSYPAELHIVHYDSDNYPNISAAIESGKLGLAVLGVFLEVGEKTNEEYDKFRNLLKQVLYKDGNVSLKAENIDLRKLLPTHVNKFFRYNGSLTTPNCQEVVIWTLFNQTVKISNAMLKTLRNVTEYPNGTENQHPLQDNFRPVQSLNSRTVYQSFESSSTCVFRFSVLLYVICSIALVTRLS